SHRHGSVGHHSSGALFGQPRSVDENSTRNASLWCLAEHFRRESGDWLGRHCWWSCNRQFRPRQLGLCGIRLHWSVDLASAGIDAWGTERGNASVSPWCDFSTLVSEHPLLAASCPSPPAAIGQKLPVGTG